MGKVKYWMMDIEEFCDNFFYGGDSKCEVGEISDLAESKFGPGAAAIPLLTLLFFTIYPVDFLNSFFIVITTVAAFLIYLLD